jgi:hypothetical protein
MGRLRPGPVPFLDSTFSLRARGVGCRATGPDEAITLRDLSWGILRAAC